jgi:hypothetical protein
MFHSKLDDDKGWWDSIEGGRKGGRGREGGEGRER